MNCDMRSNIYIDAAELVGKAIVGNTGRSCVGCILGYAPVPSIPKKESNIFKSDQIYKNVLTSTSPNRFTMKIYYIINLLIFPK